MRSVLKCLNERIREFDLFPTSTFLRYRGENEYKSVTGGCVSISVIVIFVIMFASMGLKTARREIIHTSLSTEMSSDPQLIKVKVGPEGGFMIAFFINYEDVSNATNRMFDIKFEETRYKSGYPMSSIEVPLVPCTKQHLAFTEQIQKLYDTWNFVSAFCPPLGYELRLKGKFSSPTSQGLRFLVTRCNSTADPTCMNDADYLKAERETGPFTIAMPMVVNNVNAGEKQYMYYAIQDSHYFSFGSTLGAYGQIYIQEDIIETDISLMPYQDIQKQSSISVPTSFTLSHFPAQANDPDKPLIDLYFMKSAVSNTYSRSFNKIDSYFSYVGGLIGTIIGLIFILGKYNEISYELSIARRLINTREESHQNNDRPDNDNKAGNTRQGPQEKEGRKQDSKEQDKEGTSIGGFNFCYYVLVYVKRFFNWAGCQPKWKTTQRYIDYCDQMCMQLDVAYVMQRLIFLDAAITKLLEPHQVQALHMRARPTLSALKHQRHMHQVQQRYRKLDLNSLEKKGGNTFDSSISKQHIMGNDLQYELEQPFPKQKTQDYEMSSISFSHHSQDLQRVQVSVSKVAREARQGKRVSRKIMKDINETSYDQICVAPRGEPKPILNLHSFENIEQKGQQGQKEEVSEERGKNVPDGFGFKGAQVMEVKDFEYDI